MGHESLRQAVGENESDESQLTVRDLIGQRIADIASLLPTIRSGDARLAAGAVTLLPALLGAMRASLQMIEADLDDPDEREAAIGRVTAALALLALADLPEAVERDRGPAPPR